MGTWDIDPWDNDRAADWFSELFEYTSMARFVEKTLRRQLFRRIHAVLDAAQ